MRYRWKSRGCSHKRKVNKLFSLIGWEREKLSGFTEEKRAGSLFLRRAAEFKILRRPANKLLPSWTKGTRKCETATSTFPTVFRNLLIRIYLFDAREVQRLFLFHLEDRSKSLERETKTSMRVSRTSYRHGSAARRNGSSWLRGATLTVPASPLNWINLEFPRTRTRQRRLFQTP